MKLAFTVGTTSGNQARESSSEQIIQEQLEKIGVKLTIKNSPDMLDTKHGRLRLRDDHLRLGRRARPLQRQRDLAVVGDPRASARRGWPRPASATTRVRTTPRSRTRRSTRSSTPPTSEADPAVRAALYNQADLQLATNDVTVIPLFQKPTQLGYRDTITGRAGQPDAGRLHLEHRGLDLHAVAAELAGACRGRSRILRLEICGDRVRRAAAA